MGDRQISDTGVMNYRILMTESPTTKKFYSNVRIIDCIDCALIRTFEQKLFVVGLSVLGDSQCSYTPAL